MLRKKNRVSQKTVEKIFKQGDVVRSNNLTLRFIFDSKQTLISFIVPKSTTKSAVKRNSLKRRGYYVLRTHFHKLPKGISGVFIFSKKSLNYFYGRKTSKYNPIANLNHEIKYLLNKIS